MDNYKVDDSFGFLVNRVATAMRRAFEQRLEEYGLTAPQCGFLLRLFEEDGQSLSNIGKSLYCDKPTITGIASRLEKKGFIRKVKDKDDRRIVKALLTEKGTGLKEPLRKTSMDLNMAATKGLTTNEVKLLKTNLRGSLGNLLEQIQGGVINV